MNWWKNTLLTILQKLFPAEKPDYQDIQAWAREQVVHPIYALELTCYQHGTPMPLEQASPGVWICRVCCKSAYPQMEPRPQVHNPLPTGTLSRTWYRERVAPHKTRLARLDDPREAG